MSSHPRVTRSDRVASLALRPGRVARAFGHLQRVEVLARIGVGCLAALCIWCLTGGWAPPFGYRSGYTPRRDITATVSFTVPDPQGTELLRKQRRSEWNCTYVHDDRALKEMRSALKSRMFQVLAAESADHLDRAVWNEFVPAGEDVTELDMRGALEHLRAALSADADLTRFANAVQRVFQPFEETGLLKTLAHPPEEGSQISIRMYPAGKSGSARVVDVKDVRVVEATSNLAERLVVEFRAAGLPAENSQELARLTAAWLHNYPFPTTLTLDSETTQREFLQLVPTLVAEHTYVPGDTLVRGGQPITPEKLEVLRREHAAVVQAMNPLQVLGHSVAGLGMYVALFLLCGVFVYHHQPLVLRDLRRLTTLVAVVILAVALGRLCTGELWQAEVVPIVLFGMAVAIAYSRELALLLSAAVSLVLAVALGMGLAEFVLMVATGSVAILLLNGVRSRTKLIYVGLGAALAAVLTTLGIGTLVGEPLGSWRGTGLVPVDPSPLWGGAAAARLFSGALWHGFCTVLAALIMTGLLPFVERLFDVQTDISLLELGDAAHPLLQELARRAPGTYNHSINVASLAEAAAEAIGANSLLVRVGAYFHDIGKVFKPGYFIENQGRDVNRHESLLPAMSTLVIIAHVKDGADLARQHRLPRPIVDFIEQHHGTTLVEYFYQQASRQSEGNPDREEVAESSYRYPGPKPQTREAAVMMVADAAESASRTLVDPTPARIESLVRDIAMKRLLDGQFDDCNLTLQELNRIEESLVKSLIAVYHARVKYPDQVTA